MAFVAKHINNHMFSFRTYVKHVNMDSLLEQYPEGRMDGCYEPERGYDRDEIGFVDEETGEEFYVYSRFGRVRVGGPTGVNAERLALYLQANAKELVK